jgi:hypothetical protein
MPGMSGYDLAEKAKQKALGVWRRSCWRTALRPKMWQRLSGISLPTLYTTMGQFRLRAAVRIDAFNWGRCGSNEAIGWNSVSGILTDATA